MSRKTKKRILDITLTVIILAASFGISICSVNSIMLIKAASFRATL